MDRDLLAERLFDRMWREGRISRRNVLRAAMAVAASGLIVPAGMPRAQGKPRFTAYPFTLGVASGYPSTDGVTVWTRLAPSPLSKDGGMDTGGFVDVTWQVAEDERFERIAAEGALRAVPELAHSVRADVTGLKPARTYHYRFIAGDEVSPTGRTRTIDAAPDRLRFVVASCQNFEHGWFTAWRHALAEEPDFVAFVGDYIYESNWGVGPFVRQHMPWREARTLRDYRMRIAQYRTDADLQRIHAAVPFLLTWDDHEVDNDYAGAQSEGLDPGFLLRRAAAYQAYFEHMPMPWRMLPQQGEARIYTHLDCGDLARFCIVDNRQFRSEQACQPWGKGGGDDVPLDCKELHEPGRTILGAAQEQWLSERMAGTRARWNFLTQQTLFVDMDKATDGKQQVYTDAWGGYPASRQRVIDDWRKHRVRNPVVLGGDVHATLCADVPADGRNPESGTVATEFVSTSLSSEGRAQAEWDGRLAENPAIRFADSAHRGYMSFDLTPDRLHARARALADVRNRQSAISTLVEYVVEDGKPGLQKG
jgi:alkaline phosphatase D